jgi:hypothetical protein
VLLDDPVRALFVLLLVATATLPAGSPAVAGRATIVVASDPRGDVHISNRPGLAPRDRKSIDLRRLTVSDAGNAVRFTFDVRRVDRSTRLNQAWFLNVMTNEPLYAQLQVITHQLAEPPLPHKGFVHKMSIENADTPQGFVSCKVPISYRQGTRRWWVEVPKRCLPAGQVRLNVYAQTMVGPEENTTTQMSRDLMEVPGSYDLGGTVHAPQ